MPDTHPPCARCSTTDPDAFDSPTSGWCRECWAWMTDYGRRFSEWADGVISRGRNWTPFQ